MTHIREREAFFKPVSAEVRPPAVVPTIDKLTQMYGMQAALDGRIIAERGIEKDMSEWVVGLTIAMESEIDEIRREVDWKWWKNPKEVDMDALQG